MRRISPRALPAKHLRLTLEAFPIIADPRLTRIKNAHCTTDVWFAGPLVIAGYPQLLFTQPPQRCDPFAPQTAHHSWERVQAFR
jgi:hypothetical protein